MLTDSLITCNIVNTLIAAETFHPVTQFTTKVIYLKLTSTELFEISLEVDDMCLGSSSVGGKTHPERRCKLFVAPIICWTLLLANANTSSSLVKLSS